MKESLRLLLIRKVLSPLSNWWGKVILKRRDLCRRCLFLLVYKKTFNLFPDSRLKENSDLAFLVASDLLGISLPDRGIDESKQYLELKTATESDEDARDLISTNHLITAYYYSEHLYSSFFEEEYKNSLEAAKKFASDAEPIGKNFGKVARMLRKKLKKLKSAISYLNDEKVKEEKIKSTPKVKIEQKDFLFITALFSTLIGVGGFLYYKAIFFYYGFSTADFFTLSDYLSGSVDVFLWVSIATAFGVYFYFAGKSDSEKKRIFRNQFDIEDRPGITKVIIPLIVV